jgi:hypothetical protein
MAHPPDREEAEKLPAISQMASTPSRAQPVLGRAQNVPFDDLVNVEDLSRDFRLVNP